MMAQLIEAVATKRLIKCKGKFLVQLDTMVGSGDRPHEFGVYKA